MKRILSLVAFFATLQASAQQVNPVPDYVFANRMSAGRNTVTDTAAYFSIGPRYGATRGMMPPMVVDTASFSGNKRNGLLIFSVQKNKFLYWDSVGVKWAEMAGTGGTAISSGDTAAMLSPYVRHAGYGLTKSGQSFLVDTLNISTRAWRQKGLDSLAALEVSGSGTTDYVPKFTAASTIGNSQIFDNGTNVGIGVVPGSTTLGKSLFLNYFGNGLFAYRQNDTYLTNNAYYNGGAWKHAANGQSGLYIQSNGDHIFMTAPTGNANDTSFVVEKMRILNNGRITINTPVDAGYLFDVNGTFRTVDGANFATSLGSVGIGTTSPTSKLDVNGVITTTQNGNPWIKFISTNTTAANRNWDIITNANDWGQFDIRHSTSANTDPSTTALTVRSTGTVAIGTTSPAASAKLDVASTTQGFLPPRMTTAQRDAISSPAAGLVIYNTTTSKLQVYTTTWVDLH